MCVGLVCAGWSDTGAQKSLCRAPAAPSACLTLRPFESHRPCRDPLIPNFAQLLLPVVPPMCFPMCPVLCVHRALSSSIWKPPLRAFQGPPNQFHAHTQQHVRGVCGQGRRGCGGALPVAIPHSGDSPSLGWHLWGGCSLCSCAQEYRPCTPFVPSLFWSFEILSALDFLQSCFSGCTSCMGFLLGGRLPSSQQPLLA